jgi:hypothetical protein
VSTGRREILQEQRERLFGVFRSELVEAKDLPALSRELRQVLAELETLEEPVDSDLDDEVDRKRQERLARSEAAGS